MKHDTIKQISESAKQLTTAASQKRFINKAFRELDTKQGLPSWNADFSVAQRAISRVNRGMKECSIQFTPYQYANSIAIEMRSVVKDAWN
tara:strand:- start:1244 stop:1513 length:270 start_codon:yes stop_codon:yes gene_type:complete